MTKQNQKPHIHVSAGLIRKHGKFLIAKRQKGSHLAGYWEFPGGKLEKGESPQDCLEREIEEELGIRIRAGQVLLTVEHAYEDKTISLYVMNGSVLSGQPRALECQAFKWVQIGDFQNFVFPPPDLKVIDYLSGAPEQTSSFNPDS